MEGMSFTTRLQQIATTISSRLPPPSPLPAPPFLNAASASLSQFLTIYVPVLSKDVLLPYETQQHAFARALIVIALCPLIWNILARLEYKTNILSTIFFSKYIGCFALALWIFGFSIYRDALVMDVMRICPKAMWLDEWRWQTFGMVLGIVGGVMVGSAYLRLGVTGTYLGDYFGILME